MSQKIIFLASIVIQTISCQYINGPYNPGYNGLTPEAAALANGYGYGPINPGFEAYPAPFIPSASSGGTFTVRSSSPIAPNGVSVQSENLVIEGPVAVSGQLPFLGVVSLEGPLPTAGEGTIAYGCGNGNVGITSEAELGPGLPFNGPQMNPGIPVGPNLQRPLY